MPQLIHHLRRFIGLSSRRPKSQKLKPRFRSLHARVEQLEPRRLLASTVEGVLWNDADADGELDAGESTLPGWTVFLDQNQNGQRDAGEVSVISGAGGQYSFTGLAEGTYVVGYEVPQGWHQTGPVGAVIPPDTSDPDGLNVHRYSRVSVAQFADGSDAANDITSYVSPSGREYAIIGLKKSVGFVEVTDPENPVIVATITGLDEGGGANLIGLHHASHCHPETEGCGGEHEEASVWRDVKAHNGYAYSVTEASGGIQVIDITQIDNGIVTTVDTGGQLGPSTSHNIALNPDSNHIYLAGASSGGQLIAYDLSNPALPQLAGAWSGHYVHDVTVVSYTSGPYAGSELAFAFVAGSGLRVIDVTNKANMHTIGSASYPNIRYSHSGSLSADRKYVFLNDELDEQGSANVQTTTTYILNVEDPTNPYYVKSFTNGEAATDHNSMVRGDFLFLSSYRAGLRVYDVTDPLNLVESGYYDTQPNSSGFLFSGAWGVDSQLPSGTVVVADRSRGLFVLDVGPASVPHGEYMVEVGADEVISNIDFGSQPVLTLVIADTLIAENGGATTGTVSRGGDTSSDLIVTLASSDTSEATVPGTVTILAGQETSDPFIISAVDDSEPDATQVLDISATAGGYAGDSNSLSVFDDEVLFIDNGDAGFSTVGAWAFVPNPGTPGYQTDIHHNGALGGTGSKQATWTFSGLAAGDYQVSVTWVASGNRASNAPFTIFDGATPVFSTIVNQQLAPAADAQDSGVNFQNLGGVVTVGSGTLVVELTDDANGVVIADAVRIEQTGAAGPALTLSIVDTSISENGGSTTATVSRSGDTTGALVVNLSSSDTGEATVPATITIPDGQGTSPSFTISGVDDALVDGTQAVTITGSAAGFSDGVDTLDVLDDEVSVVQIIDNGDAGFSTVGAWAFVPNPGTPGYQTDIHHNGALGGTGSKQATWTFSGLAAGDYQVSVTWVASGNRASNAPFTIFDGATPVFSTIVNQQLAPAADAQDSGVNFQNLGGVVTVGSGTLVVELTDDANGVVIADAVRIEQTGAAGPALTLSIVDTSISENGGSTTATVSRSGDTTGALVVNLSSSDTGEATVPATITIPDGQGTSPSFTISGVDDALVDGTQAVTITGSAAGFSDGVDTLDVLDDEVSVVQIIDNGDAGFSTVGAWAFVPNPGTPGYQTDIHHNGALGGTGSKQATWTFSGLAAGDYQVSVTWVASGNRASNAPFTIFDGATPVFSTIVNQQLAPAADAQDSGVNFQNLGGVVTVGSGTLVVELTDDANGVVIADAVRIEQTGAAGPALTLSIVDTSISENGGSTTATVSRSGDTTGALVVNLSSSDTGEATVPATITIPDGQGTSPSFTISGVDDALVDGTQAVTITGSAAGFSDGVDTLDVLDDEVSVVQIIDNGDAGFSTVGAWAFVPNPGTPGYQTDIHHNGALGGTGSKQATWTFSGLAAGDYQVSVTWVASGNRASNAPFTIFDGATPVFSTIVNQQLAPAADAQDSGVNFQNLGGVVTVGSGTLVVELTDDANGVVIADAVRIENLADGLVLSIDPTTISENGGSATGTVTRFGDISQQIIVSLSSNDTGEATVPATVTIDAFQSFNTFTINAADDVALDGKQFVTITASAAGKNDGTAGVTVTDDEAVIIVPNYLDGANEGFNDPAKGSARRAAFEFALDIWSALLPNAYPGETITVDAAMDPLSGNTLAQAGAISLHRDFGAGVPSTFYGAPLANHLNGSDLNLGASEIDVKMDLDTNWYLGLEANPSGGQFDFVTVTLHEVGHGLNFLDLIRQNGTWLNDDLPGIYDRFLERGDGTDLVDLNQSARAAALISNDLFWNGTEGIAGNGGTRPKIYAPNPYQGGSSTAHLDENVHGNQLMSPTIAAGQADHQPSGMEMGMLIDMGWMASGALFSSALDAAQAGVTVPSTRTYFAGLPSDIEALSKARTAHGQLGSPIRQDLSSADWLVSVEGDRLPIASHRDEPIVVVSPEQPRRWQTDSFGQGQPGGDFDWEWLQDGKVDGDVSDLQLQWPIDQGQQTMLAIADLVFTDQGL